MSPKSNGGDRTINMEYQLYKLRAEENAGVFRGQHTAVPLFPFRELPPPLHGNNWWEANPLVAP